MTARKGSTQLMKGRTCLVTGATRGIGRETALGLARMGATLVLTARDRERGRRVEEEIAEKTGNGNVTILYADLSSQRAVRALAEEVRKRVPVLHVLINNAGGVNYRRQVTEDGQELTFATNHLAPFLLTNLLLDLLKRGAPARVITVTSMIHARGRIDFDNLRYEKGYRAFGAYGDSKLANVLFTYELARRLDGSGVTANCLHPGVVASNFGRDGGFFGNLVRIAQPFMLSPEKGARTSIYLASSPEVEGATGKYFIRCREARSSRASRDKNLAGRLWEVSESLTGFPRPRAAIA